LLITELILWKKLHERSPAEVAAMLSATTCQHKSGEEAVFGKDSMFFKLKEDVLSINEKIKEAGAKLRIQVVDIGDELRFDLMEVVYYWANGTVLLPVL
uniref:DSHCT domain-containing protein n=1 Tax=Angiostrongylus cantonensis TaxID=6313 RepID=A0A0K0D4I7_ANGCA